MPVFCRHNRFTAECPICSKDSVLGGRGRTARRRAAGPSTARAAKAAPAAFAGPHVAGPAREGEDGALVVVRLERVPGGVRLAEWSGARPQPRAPVLAPEELAGLVARCAEALPARDATRLLDAIALAGAGAGTAGDGAPVAGAGEAADGAAAAGAGVSAGRSGDFRDELRVEPLGDGRLRVARWVLRPAAGWELQDAPPMLPAARYAEALADAARRGLIPAPSPR